MKLVRFDWAMKHLPRDKANYSVLEGFLSVLLNEKVTIKQILSSHCFIYVDETANVPTIPLFVGATRLIQHHLLKTACHHRLFGILQFDLN